MKYCDGDRKCTYIRFNRQCLAATSHGCEHKITVRDQEAGRVIEVPDLDSVKCAMPPADFTRIADALERIATALEKANELKAVEIKMGSIPAYREEHDGDELAKIIQSDVNEIMED